MILWTLLVMERSTPVGVEVTSWRDSSISFMAGTAFISLFILALGGLANHDPNLLDHILTNI